jgi:hypothetical protein
MHSFWPFCGQLEQNLFICGRALFSHVTRVQHLEETDKRLAKGSEDEGDWQSKSGCSYKQFNELKLGSTPALIISKASKALRWPPLPGH